MSQHQKENLVSLIATLTASSLYILYIFNRYSNSSVAPQDELKYWAAAILLAIPFRIVVQIVIYIGFKIAEGIAQNGVLKEDIKDERDKVIELKGNNIASNIFVMGFMGAMIAILFFGSTLSAMFAIMFVAGYVGELIGIFAKIYFYNKGV